MLKEVLAGKSFTQIAEAAGLSRATVGVRVRAIDLELRSSIGVAGLASSGALDVEVMRQHRDAYLRAIRQYKPSNSVAPRRSVLKITDSDVDRVVDVTRARSRCPDRDVALIYTLFGTGAKPLEIAQLTVADYLCQDGTVRADSTMRAEISVNGVDRPLYFDSKRLVDAIDHYLAKRATQGYGTGGMPGQYRGLIPDSRLFLTEDGAAMPVMVRQRTQRHCSVILDLFRTIFVRAGMRGAISLSARRALANKLLVRRCDVDDIATLLGISRESVREMLVCQSVSLREAICEVV